MLLFLSPFYLSISISFSLFINFAMDIGFHVSPFFEFRLCQRISRRIDALPRSSAGREDARVLLGSLRNDIQDLIRIEDCLQKLMRYLPRSSRALATMRKMRARSVVGTGGGGRRGGIARDRSSYRAIYPGAVPLRDEAPRRSRDRYAGELRRFYRRKSQF
jgi:hypothetical protein